nr:MAG TPA: hypothetical protein [Caudoviricetes sp.]
MESKRSVQSWTVIKNLQLPKVCLCLAFLLSVLFVASVSHFFANICIQKKQNVVII